MDKNRLKALKMDLENRTPSKDDLTLEIEDEPLYTISGF